MSNMTKKEIEDFLGKWYSESVTDDSLVAEKLGIDLDKLYNFCNNFVYEANQIPANNESRYFRLISMYADLILNYSKQNEK